MHTQAFDTAPALHQGSPSTWGATNPRYVSYCLTLGYRNPEEALAVESERWQGGVMCGFMLWITEQLAAFKQARGLPPREPIGGPDGVAFTRFLAALPLPDPRAGAPVAAGAA